MAKKAIHHFNRGVVIGLEIIGVCALLLFLAWGMLLWRLSQGPLDMGFLTQKLERALNAQQHSFAFDVATTHLTWGGRMEPFELEMTGVQINRADNTPVALVQKLGVQLSRRSLVFGRIVPKVIRIHGPALRVIRWEDGHFSLNLAEGVETPPAPVPVAEEENSEGAGQPEQPEEPAPEKEASGPSLIRELLLALQEQKLPLLGGLRRIEITDAAVFYDDKILGAGWKSHRARIVFEHGRAGIVVESDMEIGLADGHNAYVRTNASYDWMRKETTVFTAFNGVNPALAAQGSEALKDLAEVKLPLKGSLAFMLDGDFRPGRARLLLGADAGTFNAFGLYKDPMPVHQLYAEGTIDLTRWEGEISAFRADLGGPGAEATARLHTGPNGEKVIDAQATLTEMPMDDLHRFWSSRLAADAQKWVTEHLSAGIAHRATLDVSLAIDGPAGERKARLESLGGEIDFTGITVDYFAPLMPVKGVDGRAVYDSSSFTLALTSGTLGDMTVSKSDIRITGLDTQAEGAPSEIDIAVSLSGPLKTALEVLDSKPLEYPKELGLSTAGVRGTADVDVFFKFPLHHALAVEDVEVRASAKLADAYLQDIVAGYALSGGEGDLAVDNGALKVKGSGKLGDMPVTFDWMKNFSASAEVTSRVAARLPLDAAAMLAFGAPEMLSPGGTLPVEIVHTERKDKTAVLDLKGSLENATFSLPVVGFSKTAGAPGDISFTLLLKNGTPDRMKDLTLQTAGMIARGDMEFGAGGLRNAAFGQVVFGETDISFSAKKVDTGGLALTITGRQLDATPLLGDDEDEAAAPKKKEPPSPPEKTDPLFITLDIPRVITGKNRALEGVKTYLHIGEWQRIEQFEMDAKAGKGAVYLRYMPVPDGRTLRFEADDAGSALRILGLSSAVKGGKLAVHAAPAGGGPRDLKGTATLTNFTLVKAPALARLLNAMSLPGFIEALNGSGISFKKARGEFFWTDRGPPADTTPVRNIKIKDGQTSGASLGLTFEGNVDTWNDTYDLDGTIVPVSDLSKLLNNIPIIGTVLTAGGEGVFAATYTVKGPKSDPTVTVNPLAALAPGVLRKLFFEN